jgi:pilus assembly protein CpaF
LADPTVSEIMVNSATEVFVERHGVLYAHDVSFSSDEAIRAIIDRIVQPIGRRIDDASPMVDARLPDGSRVNAIVPPLALRGPSITIRKFNRNHFSLEQLVQSQSLSSSMAKFLEVCVVNRKNIIVSGGTGSGKTTLLNVLSSLIPESERVITIEDSAELKLHHKNLVGLEARPVNIEGRGAISIRDLVRNSLRMRPDRIVVGEVRGGEALDMLQAMNTGHDGSLTTVHANSARDVFSRLEVMSLMGGIELPVAALREQICSAVDVIVHQSRFADGSRRISSILEVSGIESGRIQALELFKFDSTAQGAMGPASKPLTQNSFSKGGAYVSCGVVPSFYETLNRAGIELDYSIFERREVHAESRYD